jgi:hypothetical protein
MMSPRILIVAACTTLFALSLGAGCADILGMKDRPYEAPGQPADASVADSSQGGSGGALPDGAGGSLPDGATADGGACAATQKRCGGVCVEVSDPAYGCQKLSCSPACGGDPHGVYVCGGDGGACTKNGCETGYKECDGLCMPKDAAHGCGAAACTKCPDTNSTASCDAGGACALTCDASYKLCGGACVAVNDPGFGCTQSACSPACVVPDAGTVLCSGGSCQLGACGADTKNCGGSCVPTDEGHGCASASSCAACAANETCVSGSCQCVADPKATTCLGRECGTFKNNCGTDVDCGSCSSPETCNGGGTPNQCGCTATSPCTGSNCDTVTDTCNVGVTCACASGTAVCKTGACCEPTVDPCSGNKCGTVPDGCGGTVVCTAQATRTCSVTFNVTGICQAGTESCVSNAWDGNCVGQVAPQARQCNSSADNDCDGTIDSAETQCNSGTSQCSGTTPQTCTSCQWTDGAPCSGSTPLCNAGACVTNVLLSTTPTGTQTLAYQASVFVALGGASGSFTDFATSGAHTATVSLAFDWGQSGGGCEVALQIETVVDGTVVAGSMQEYTTTGAGTYSANTGSLAAGGHSVALEISSRAVGCPQDLQITPSSYGVKQDQQ